jgi:F-type H+-transporting ATPase subunit b
MDEILGQLGELLLGSVPTVIFLLLVYVLYTVLVHKPLAKVLEERHNRTEGAIERARADIAAAEARTAEYEQRLREARVALFRQQEARRQAALQVRDSVLKEAHSRAQAEIEQARAGIEEQKQAAKSGLQEESVRLAEQIVSTVLRPVSAHFMAGSQ